MKQKLLQIRRGLGICFISFAVKLIPGTESIWPSVRNLQSELADYDRYCAWCESMRQASLPFYEWQNWARSI